MVLVLEDGYQADVVLRTAVVVGAYEVVLRTVVEGTNVVEGAYVVVLLRTLVVVVYLLAGQLVTVGLHLVMVTVWVMDTVDVMVPLMEESAETTEAERARRARKDEANMLIIGVRGGDLVCLKVLRSGAKKKQVVREERVQVDIFFFAK